MEQEEELSVADTGQAGAEAARRPALVLGSYGFFVTLPVLSVGGISDQVIKHSAGVAVV